MKADFDELQFVSKRNHSTYCTAEHAYSMYLAPKFSIQESIENGHDMEKKSIQNQREAE